LTFSFAAAGIFASSFSIGEPTIPASFIASAGLSSSCFARRSAFRSSGDSVSAADDSDEIGSMSLLETGE
jgi:hypothetical protein